jgi:hypothetical protein
MSPTFQGTAVVAYAIRRLVVGRAATIQLDHARLPIITFGEMSESAVLAAGRTFTANAAHA